MQKKLLFSIFTVCENRENFVPFLHTVFFACQLTQFAFLFNNVMYLYTYTKSVPRFFVTLQYKARMLFYLETTELFNLLQKLCPCRVLSECFSQALAQIMALCKMRSCTKSPLFDPPTRRSSCKKEKK